MVTLPQLSDRPLPFDKQTRNPNHHRVILALSTAFWDAFLRSRAPHLRTSRSPLPCPTAEW